MFGISFFEFVIILTIFILVVNPSNYRDIIRNIFEFFYKLQDYVYNIKDQIIEISKDSGIDEIKNDIEKKINSEKIKDITEITDLYGVKHKINDENFNKES